MDLPLNLELFPLPFFFFRDFQRLLLVLSSKSMKKLTSVIATISFILLLPVLVFAQQDKDVEAVKAILFQQQADWNRADIDAFMKGYWKSDELQFAGSSGVIYGWQNTMDRYKRNYPDPETMGQLTFEILRVKKLQKKVILLTGKFTLERKNDQPSGYFTLIWKKIKGKWLIVSDHTS